MKRILYALVLASASMLPLGCDSTRTNGNGKGYDESATTAPADEALELTELTKASLPCSKEMLSVAWKQIEAPADTRRGKALDYKQHSPTLFLSADLDGDDIPEILLRGESPYAAVFSYAADTLHLITFVDHAQNGLGVTPEGAIVRSGSSRDGSLVSQFIRLDGSLPAATGESREKFSILGGKMVSSGVRYYLQGDSAMAEVSQEEYQESAPRQGVTFFEDIEGWEDFRKP